MEARACQVRHQRPVKSLCSERSDLRGFSHSLAKLRRRAVVCVSVHAHTGGGFGPQNVALLADMADALLCEPDPVLIAGEWQVERIVASGGCVASGNCR